MKEEKLTLEHLAPYLSYNIMAYGASDYWNITGLNQTKITLKNALHSLLISIDDFSVDYDLLLHPLSDLAKEIEHNGKKFIGRDEFNDIQWATFCDFEGFEDWMLLTKLLEYESVIELIKRHFDVFGLIEKGLAIDINTI